MPAPELLAFVHIEKAAGTSLIHILRKNFFPGYVDVRPLRPSESGEFSVEDLREYKRINPWLTCIGGHSVKPYTGLEEAEPGIRYITVLRNPIKRYMSQYIYWRDRMGKSITFEDFLALPKPRNFQVKKIAGEEDVEKALQILQERFLMVGTVERFQEFLLLLANKLAPQKFSLDYKEQNVARKSMDVVGILNRYESQIEENNAMDLEFYAKVQDGLISGYIAEYGEAFDKDLSVLCAQRGLSGANGFLHYTDYLMRKIYIEPLTNGLRYLRGVPARGSY